MTSNTSTLDNNAKVEANNTICNSSLPCGEGRGEVFIIKVGGAVVEDDTQLSALLESFCNIKGKKVLVHGGGRRATKVAADLGIETVMVGGRRITDEKMLEVVTMVYGGLVNKNLVAQLQARDTNAIGLTGTDMNIILSHKRPKKKMTVEGEEMMVDFGYVGDVDNVDADRLAALIEAGITPVIAPLTHDGEGHMLNTNADTMASETAKAIAALRDDNGEPLYDVTLTYCFEKNGVLRYADDDDSVIPVITRADFEQLCLDGTIAGGMIPKIENALAAVESGVNRVVITKFDNLNGGTIIQ